MTQLKHSHIFTLVVVAANKNSAQIVNYVNNSNAIRLFKLNYLWTKIYLGAISELIVKYLRL